MATTAKEVAKRLVSVLESFPKERIEHFASFKEVQAERFAVIAGLPSKSKDLKTTKSNKSITEIVSSTLSNKSGPKDTFKTDALTSQVLEQQLVSAANISQNKYSTYYPISSKLLKPKGNPNYYDRLVGDLEKGGKQKEGLLSGMMTVITGKY
ncbi:hypothetical protein LJB42_002622 [Komagataella kurtzmanii]|nr:hypothetical protein LJB42_002622 [Komagataella kurtzmanii]